MENIDLNYYKQLFASYFETAINNIKGHRKNKTFNSEEQLYHFSNIYHKIINQYFKFYNDDRGNINLYYL
jgi:hypothetical protein